MPAIKAIKGPQAKGQAAQPEQKKKVVNYSELRVLTDEESEKTERLMRELGDMIRVVRREYDLWFAGTNSKPPYELRNKLDTHVRLMRAKLPKRTADQFKLATVLQQYQTFAEHWDKSQRKQEEGGLAPWLAASHRQHGVGATLLDQIREQNEQRAEEVVKPVKSNYVGRVASPDQDVDEIRKVFNSYAAAKRKVGEQVNDQDFDKFKSAIVKQSRQIIDSGKAAAVSYRIEIQDGKVAIKAKAEQ